MPLVDAALAFAITMLAVATVVTGIVRFLDWVLPHVPLLVQGWLTKWLGERAQIFERMITEFLTRELKNIIQRELNIPEADALTRATEAIDAIKTDLANGGPLTHIANSDLVDKLKQTALGKDLMALPGRANEVFDEISRRYAAVERRYTEMFRANARIVATAVALLLALIFNIDSINIADAYLKDPALSATIAARTDGVMKDFDAQLAQLSPDQANGQQQETGATVLKQFQESSSLLRKQLDLLNTSGFPFGWAYFPLARAPVCSLKFWLTGFGWLAGIGLTGFFAGLGAPFWFDVLRNLSVLAQGKAPSGAAPQP